VRAYPWLVDAVLLATLGPALILDLRFRRIPHWLTLPAMAIGLLLAAAFFGWGESWAGPGLRGALCGGVLAYAIFAAMVVTAGMGGGDATLMAAVGTLLGFPAVLGAVLFTALAGGIEGLVALSARTAAGRRVCLRLGLAGAADPEFGKSVPYGVAIAAGTLAFRLWQRLGAP